MTRVIFDDAINLGVILPNKTSYQIGSVFEVPQGEVVQLIAYNGDTSGAITFTLSFSGGLSRTIAIFATLLPVLLYLYIWYLKITFKLIRKGLLAHTFFLGFKLGFEAIFCNYC